MKIDDVRELFTIADQDFASAVFLTKMFPQPLENICYLCAQATEKYLKGFLEFHGVIPDKIHNLVKLLESCINIDESFKNIVRECKILNKFKSKIRYDRSIQVNSDDMNFVLRSTEKIKNLEVLKKIRESVLT